MSNTPSHFRYPDWQSLYFATLVETDPSKLASKLSDAETAIFNRLQTLSSTPGARDERNALDDAIHNLRTLKRDSLKFPDWT